MKAITVTLPRFKPMCGWTNRLLRIDLSTGKIWAHESAPYLPTFIGARGIAAKIVWDEFPRPVDPFHPDNPFMVIPGALTGTIAPYSGRTIVCSFSPQSWPYPWFTRSSIGANWGARLKRAGYDGLIVTGASDTPVQIVIHDDEVRILPADSAPTGDGTDGDALWDLDTIEAQEAIQARYGKAARTLCIGPAGQHLSRIATVQTETGSAAGQGGFGAVLGAKKLNENWVNPELGTRMFLHRTQFLPLMDEYYRLRGWDVETGWPTPKRLAQLGLDGVHAEMVSGAKAAQERLPKQPPERPVQDIR